MSISILNRGASGGMTASIFVNGLGEADTVTASKDGKVINGVLVQKPNPAYVVPDGYTQLEHIESTGTQFVNTGIKASSNVDVEIDYFGYTANGSENVLFGGSNGSWPAQLGVNNSVTQGQTLAYYNYDGFTGYAIQTACKYKLASGVLYANNVQVYSDTFSAFSYNHNIYLFAQNWAGTVQNHSKFKLRSFKMWENKVLVRDFVPVKRNSDGVIGLYDIVNNAFYTNAGSGTFVAGKEIPQYLYHHEITGIKDTGVWTVTATNGTKTTTQDVLVEVIGLYEIEMFYRDYLYHEGDECEDITGGWDCPSVKTGNNYYWDSYNAFADAPTRTKNSDNLYVKAVCKGGGNSNYAITGASFWAKNAIDLTNITTLYFDANIMQTGANFNVSDKNPFTTTWSIEKTSPIHYDHNTLGESIVSIDVSGLSGSYYVGFGVSRYERVSYSVECCVSNVWYE